MSSIGDITGRIVIVDKGSSALVGFTKSLELHAKKAEALGKRLSDVGQSLTTKLTIPLAALGGIAVKSAMDFESSFAGVRKTVDATEAEFAKLQAQIRALAAGPDAIPIDVNKLNAVAEAAGQLGIAKGDIVDFTRTMADLGETTNLTADEAATATAQFQNIFGAAGKEVDRFGSTLVALGNAGASTERSIIEMGLRIAGTGNLIGLTQGEVLAFANALSGVGIDAEAGGTAISRVMGDISLAVSKGGKELNNFAAVARMSTTDFKTAFEQDAAGAVASFIEGLGQLDREGANVLLILDQMGITERRMQDALTRAAGAGDQLRNSLKLQAEAWRDNNALTSEAQKRYKTFESQLQLFLNRIKDITITFGTALLPVLLDTLDAMQPWIDALKSMAEGFANTSPAVKILVVSIAAITAAIGPAVFITGQLLLAWSQIVVHAPGVVTALRSVTLATQGLMVVGVLLFINELIKAWGRASDAVTQYNLEVAKIEGNALAFAQQVSQGALNKVVSQETFDQKLKEADILAEHIKRITVEVDNLNKAIKTGAGDQAYFAKQKLPEKEQELKNLWAAYSKLRSALAEVTIAGEKVEEAFTPSPFAGLKTESKEAEKALLNVAQAIEDLRQAAIQAENKSTAINLGTKAFNDLEISIQAQNKVRELNNTLVEHGLSLTSRQIALIGQYIAREAEANKILEQRTRKLEILISQTSNIALNQFAKGFAEASKLAAGEIYKVELQVNQLLSALKTKRDLGFDTEFQIKLNLVTETDARMRAIEIEYLHFVRQLGNGSLAEGEKVFAEMGKRFGWTVEGIKAELAELLDAERFALFLEKFDRAAEDLASSLVSNWRRAWEENESIIDATVDTLRDSFLNVLQDIISQWLSAWFKAMAAWLARWIATQAAAKTAQASLGNTGGMSGGIGGGGMFSSAASGASGAGVSTSAMMGAGLAAFGLYVIYKGFIEDHERKFARVTISDGAIGSIQSHGKKYLDGITQAAEAIVASVKEFLSDIDVEMSRLGNVIIEASKSGFNVSIPGSTGKLFSSMEEAISYAQVLMMKYGEFADSVSTLVKGVITSTKAISIEQLAGDLDWARMLETQNLEQAALDVSNAMDVAIANWKRAEDMFLSFYSVNLPAFEAAIDSIITKLGSDLINVYNRLAGIEEDPEKAWQRQKAAYNAQRLLVLAQLKLWELEIKARIANYNAQLRILGGPGGGGPPGQPSKNGGSGGLIGLAEKSLMVAGILSDAAGIIDPALQALLDIQDLINRAINETPPELTDTDFPGKGRKGGGGGKNRREMRADIRDELDSLEAEAKGALHAAFNDLNNNLAAFRERAKEAKLPAAELARGIELLTEAFRRSVRQQARDYAGLDSELSKRLSEIQDFFDEVRELGPDATGISTGEADDLEAKAIEELGKDLSQLILEFAGLADPMLAIIMRADELREGVIAFAEAAGWSSEQIDEAMRNIEKGIENQRLQGINSALGNLFNILKQAGLYAADALEFERRSTLLQLQIIEAQLRFYDALDARAQEWIDAARDFVESPEFGQDNNRDSNVNNRVIAVRVVEDERDMLSDLFDEVIAAVEDWREAIDDFARSTQDLLTDEALTNLTQEQQLAFAKGQFDELLAKAQGGDVEALKMLADARREYLEELRESEGGGYGYDKAFEEIMKATAELLKNAKSGEQNLIDDMLKDMSVPLWRLPDLLERLDTTLYDGIHAIVNAIYEAIGGVPAMASGGIVMNGPRLVKVAEYVPEAIVPLNRLSQMIPYKPQMMAFDPSQNHRSGMDRNRQTLSERNSLARLSAVEESNERIARALNSIKDDMSAMRRGR